tara:strand:+ start:198 stop:398 length:201 start_codon:yes stop_codon:yes gene_type:complete
VHDFKEDIKTKYAVTKAVAGCFPLGLEPFFYILMNMPVMIGAAVGAGPVEFVLTEFYALDADNKAS